MSENGDVSALPLVAIVTPVYNGAKYLAKAMQSVQAQSYPNIVHIVLNNASTDDTARVVASFLGARVRVISHANEKVLPLQDNWNKAFSYIPDDAVYAKLLCADDLVRFDCIEKFVELAESDPQVEVVLSHDVLDDDVRRANLTRGMAIFDGRAVARRILESTISWLPYHHFFVRLHPELRGNNFCGTDSSQDPYVVVRSAIRGKFGYIHEPLVYTRWHTESVSYEMVRKNDNKPLLVNLALLRHFGRSCYTEREYKDVLERYLGRIARFVVLWKIRGQGSDADRLLQVLLENGLRFSALDYVRHLASWPAYALKKLRSKTPIGPHIDEIAFTSTCRPSSST
jgi:glycosyltransferase involved in cell wall biosynthesis